MKELLLTLTFLISITGLLFKTTEEGKNGIKKISKWGYLLLSLMVGLLFLNFLISKKDKLNNELALQAQKTKDSITLTQQQKFSDSLTKRLMKMEEELSSQHYPVDTLFLSFEIELKVKENRIEFYENLLREGEWYPSDHINRFKIMKLRDSLFYKNFSDLHFDISFSSETPLPGYFFDLKNTDISIDDPDDYRLPETGIKKKSYMLLYYNPATQKITLIANRLKTKEFDRGGASGLGLLGSVPAIVSVTPEMSFSQKFEEDFDFDLLNISLSNERNDRILHFDGFIPVEGDDPYDWRSFKSKNFWVR